MVNDDSEPDDDDDDEDADGDGDDDEADIAIASVSAALAQNAKMRQIQKFLDAELGTDGDDDVSSLGADDNDRNKSADDRSLSNGSLEDDDRSFRSHPMTAWDSSPPFFSLGNGNGPPAAAFPSHSRDDASL